MKPVGILSAAGGMDVMSPEGEIRNDCVRTATNVVIRRNGGFDRRDGAERVVTVTRPHSFWKSRDGSMTLYVAGGVLYRLTGSGSSLVSTQLATGLWADPARYAEMGGNAYVSAGKILRVAPDNTVTIPGVASLFGFAPTLTEIGGGLRAGVYGVAFSAVTATGEESGMSDIAWINLASGGGISIALLPSAPSGVTHYRVYRTGENDEILRLVDTIVAAASTTIVGGSVGREEKTWPLDLLPYGVEIAAHGGRLWSAIGGFLFFDEALMPGLFDPRKNFFAFGEDIRMVQPVEDGIFVGTDSVVWFLDGLKPSEMRRRQAAANGAFKHSSMLVDANQLDGRAIDTTKPCAVWLSPVGYQIGKPGGTVLSLQADKVSLSDVERAPSVAFTRGGVKQIVSAVEAVTLGNGGASDSTP